MNKLVPELTGLFNFLYPGHTMFLNIDWSAIHTVMAPGARTCADKHAIGGQE